MVKQKQMQIALLEKQKAFLILVEDLQQQKIWYHGWGVEIAKIIQRGYYTDIDLEVLRNTREKYIKTRGKPEISNDMKNLGNTKTK